MWFGYCPKSFFIYKAISRSRADYAVLTALAIPNVGASGQPRKITPRKIIGRVRNCLRFNYLFKKIPFKWLGIKPAKYNLAGGEKSPPAYKYTTDKNTEILWLHTLDYDLYLDEKMRLDKDRDEYIVFLDEYVPFHPDYLHLEVRAPATPEQYYPVLNRFFDHLERKTGKRVVIAAHPCSHYEKMPDYYEKREVIRGETIRLVKGADIVLTHSSTAVNFAVLFNKPLMFVTTREVDRHQKQLITNMSFLLGKKPIRIDESYESKINLENELAIDSDKYEKYKNDYIKKNGSPEQKFWQIFADRLKVM
jgi:hypothetical protein